MSISFIRKSGLNNFTKPRSFGNLNEAADFSNTPTGTGPGYKFLRFTSSGTFTVTKAGMARVLIIGGGGGAGLPGYFPGGGAGGAGGYQEQEVYLPVGSYSVAVAGAGGQSMITYPGSTRRPIVISYAGGGGGNSPPHGGRDGGSGASGGGAGYGGVAGTALFSQAQGSNASGGTGGGAGGAGTGLVSDITGSNVTYSRGGSASTPAVANSGNGSPPANVGGGASSGVVIVRVSTT